MLDKIIFLDFDGVLTSFEDKTAFQCCTQEGFNYGVSEKCLDTLLDLIEKTNAKVVIASNWRKHPDDGYWTTLQGIKIKNPLPSLYEKLGSLIVGKLPIIEKLITTGITGKLPIIRKKARKSEMVKKWIEENNFSNKYVILEDNVEYEGYDKFKDLMNHMVLVNKEVGFTKDDEEKALKILS